MDHGCAVCASASPDLMSPPLPAAASPSNASLRVMASNRRIRAFMVVPSSLDFYAAVEDPQGVLGLPSHSRREGPKLCRRGARLVRSLPGHETPSRAARAPRFGGGLECFWSPSGLTTGGTAIPTLAGA